jgi:hypothetical protein
MEQLKKQIAALPTLTVGGERYLACQAVTDAIAAFLFPTQPVDQIDEAGYRRILETADSLCRELGYVAIAKLTPPEVPFAAMGLYWTVVAEPAPEPELVLIHTGPGPAEMLAEGALLDARLSRPSAMLRASLGLDEVTRQHFKIPVTASEAVVDLLHRAVASGWPNDYRGIWHDVCGMCITGGRDISPTERLFSVIIRGVGQQRYWRFVARLESDGDGQPYLSIHLADEPTAAGSGQLFALGRCLVTPGVQALGIDIRPFLALHAQGKWGELHKFDVRQNNLAVKQGGRILSAYDAPLANGETARIWLITEADRSATVALLPEE